MTFLKNVVTSVKDFEKYAELASKPVSSTIKYIVILIAILTIIVSGIFVYQIFNLIQYVKDDLPDFEFKDDVLQINTDKPIEVKNSNLFFKSFIINTNEISDEEYRLYKSKIGNSMTGIAFLKDKVLISTSPEIGAMEYSYKDLSENLQIDSLSKEEIVNTLSGDMLFYTLTIFFVTFFIYGFMYYLMETLMLVLAIMVLGHITSIIVKIRLKLYAIFNIAIYSFTLPIILLLMYSVIHMFTGFEIIYFNIMYFGIACIYMITAILMIKSDLIKRQQELEKIIEEQAKIAQQQKLEEERKKEEQDKNQDEDKQEDKKENNKDGKENKGETSKKKKKKDLDENPEPQANMFENKKGIQEK